MVKIASFLDLEWVDHSGCIISFEKLICEVRAFWVEKWLRSYWNGQRIELLGVEVGPPELQFQSPIQKPSVTQGASD